MIVRHFRDSVKTLALQFKLKVDNGTERTLLEPKHILLRHIYGRDEALDSFGIDVFSAKSAHYTQLVNTATWLHWLKEKVFCKDFAIWSFLLLKTLKYRSSRPEMF